MLLSRCVFGYEHRRDVSCQEGGALLCAPARRTCCALPCLLGSLGDGLRAYLGMEGKGRRARSQCIKWSDLVVCSRWGSWELCCAAGGEGAVWEGPAAHAAAV
jgi:hypothetical protein